MRHDGYDMGGNGALVFSALVFVCVSLLSSAVAVPYMPADTGICLPAPQDWGLPPLASLALNIGLVLLSAIWLIAINRRFNFIPSTSVLYASLLLLMAGGSSGLSGSLSSSTLLLVANVASLRLLFGQYGKWNVNPASIFVAGSLFSLGSMVHYSFLFFIFAYAGSAALLKTFHLRECVALVLGIVAPYWVVLGTGLVPLDAIHIPVPGTIWQAAMPGPEMLWLILTVGLTALWGLFAAFRNALSLFSASTAVRAYNYALTLPALACLILLIVDWENFVVYYMPLCLFTGIEGGYLAAYGKRPAGMVIYWSVAVVYTAFALISLFNV